MDMLGFNDRFNNAVDRLLRGGTRSVEEEQEHLRTFLPQIENERDRHWAANRIEELPRAATRPERSRLYAEALEIQASAFHVQGTDEERVAALDEARKRIWELAEQTSGDEQAGIRSLTRMLEHLQQSITNPPWTRQSEGL